MNDVPNVSAAIANIFAARDEELFNVIIGSIDECLSKPEWLMDHSNYSRSDDNEIRFNFKLIELLRGTLRPEERQWPARQVGLRIRSYYENRGFTVNLSSTEELTLKVDGNDSNKTDGEVEPGEATA